MAKRRDRNQPKADAFRPGQQESDAPAEGDQWPSLSDIANTAYQSSITEDEAFARLSREKVVARRLPIHDITPDPLQPRRVLPVRIRQKWAEYWHNDPAQLRGVMGYWLKAIETEGGPVIDVPAYLKGDITDRIPADPDAEPDPDQPRSTSPLAESLLRLLSIAASIRQDGLTNPITVAPAQQGQTYTIETGERRWLAYHLLYLYDREQPDQPHEDWERIPARIMEGVDIWRQATENNARDDLNAISKARQLARLLMSLYPPEHFAPPEHFSSEQDYYAQVADGEKWRTPRNSGERLLTALGFKNTAQLRAYRRLLRLPPLVWLLADDLDWSEHYIRKNLVEKHGEDLDKMTAVALDLAQKQGYTVSALTVYGQNRPEMAHLLDDDKKKPPTEKPVYERGEPLLDAPRKQRFSRLLRVHSEVEQVDLNTRDELLNDINELEAWLRDLRQRLK